MATKTGLLSILEQCIPILASPLGISEGTLALKNAICQHCFHSTMRIGSLHRTMFRSSARTKLDGY